MSSPIPSGFDPQASLDAALFAAAGGSSTASSDPAVGALESLGSSYADEISFLQQQVVPPTGAYDAGGTLAGGAGESEAAQLEQALSGLLGGSSGSAGSGLLSGTVDAGATADEQLFASAVPALAYDRSGSLLGGAGSSLLDFLG